jgi:hypothetical protein
MNIKQFFKHLNTLYSRKFKETPKYKHILDIQKKIEDAYGSKTTLDRHLKELDSSDTEIKEELKKHFTKHTELVLEIQDNLANLQLNTLEIYFDIDIPYSYIEILQVYNNLLHKLLELTKNPEVISMLHLDLHLDTIMEKHKEKKAEESKKQTIKGLATVAAAVATAKKATAEKHKTKQTIQGLATEAATVAIKKAAEKIPKTDDGSIIKNFDEFFKYKDYTELGETLKNRIYDIGDFTLSSLSPLIKDLKRKYKDPQTDKNNFEAILMFIFNELNTLSKTPDDGLFKHNYNKLNADYNQLYYTITGKNSVYFKTKYILYKNKYLKLKQKLSL